MPTLSEAQLLQALLALAVLLLFARAGGELARRLGLPEVLGEFSAGFVLGPSVLGLGLPTIYHGLFLATASGLVLSGISWLGAILLLLIAGLEVDLAILRAEARPGALAALGAIVPSIGAGIAFTLLVLRQPLVDAFFLGIVLSVSAVSVAAKILIERELLRRRFAQVTLAAGIASEVVVWLLVSIVSAAKLHSPVIAIRSAIFAVGFFLLMLTVGRRFVFWAMRRVADSTHIVKGQLTLVVVLMLLCASVTQAMGLHPLLGAFVLGVLLSRAPRRNRSMIESIQTLTTSFFAPVFFGLAGMRVDLPQLGGAGAIGLIALLLVVSAGVKIGCGMLGARLGGLSGWEAALVGLGVNLKGGTDVIVAIVGVELGLLSGRVYTLYAVVAILTVLLSPPVMAWVERRAPPSPQERERLEREEVARHVYARGVERVLVPMAPQLLPALPSSLVSQMALAKHAHQQILDVTELVPPPEEPPAGLVWAASAMPASAMPGSAAPTVVEAEADLQEVSALSTVEVVQRPIDTHHLLRSVLEATRAHDLLAIGAHPIAGRTHVSFGRLQDALIQRAESDLLIVAAADEQLEAAAVRRILVPISGQHSSTAAADTAAWIALAGAAEGVANGGVALGEGPAEGAQGPELVLLHVVSPQMDAFFWREQDHRTLRHSGQVVAEDVATRLRRLGVNVSTRVQVGTDPEQAILAELARSAYQLVVLGGYSRSGSGRPYLGTVISKVLAQSRVPVALLLTRQREDAVA